MTITKKILFILFVALNTGILAQEIVTDRPDQTESSITVGKQTFQIESGLSFENYKKSKVKSFVAPSTLLRYGVSNGFELRVVIEHQKTEIKLDDSSVDYRGFNDVEVGAKIQVLNDTDKNTEIAFLSHIIFPTANTELTTNNFGVVNKLAISHILSESINLGYNIGYNLIAKQSAFTYSLAFELSISNTIAFYMEPYGCWGEQNQFESNFDSGLTFLLNPNFQLDVSYGTGLNHKMNYVAVGFSWKTPRFLEK